METKPLLPPREILYQLIIDRSNEIKAGIDSDPVVQDENVFVDKMKSLFEEYEKTLSENKDEIYCSDKQLWREEWQTFIEWVQQRDKSEKLTLDAIRKANNLTIEEVGKMTIEELEALDVQLTTIRWRK